MKIAAFEKACEGYKGFCSNCKKMTRAGCEPDARGYNCPRCKKDTVYGAEEAMMMGILDVG
jgi:hypothetical protein